MSRRRNQRAPWSRDPASGSDRPMIRKGCWRSGRRRRWLYWWASSRCPWSCGLLDPSRESLCPAPAPQYRCSRTSPTLPGTQPSPLMRYSAARMPQMRHPPERPLGKCSGCVSERPSVRADLEQAFDLHFAGRAAGLLVVLDPHFAACTGEINDGLPRRRRLVDPPVDEQAIVQEEADAVVGGELELPTSNRQFD